MICTCYDGSPIAYDELPIVFEDEQKANLKKKAYKVEITEVKDMNNDGAVNLLDVQLLLQNDKNSCVLLKGNGDFRSPECMKLLEEADIVVTNPPFSLFREYVAQLVQYEKKFLIIGNQNAITYKEIFPLIKDNKMWLGLTMNGSNRWFQVPDNYSVTPSTKIENGKKYCFVKAVVWFTNLDHKRNHEPLILYRKYNSEEYPKYDNYNAIEVGEVKNIPIDYDGIMGVPISFLHKYCPDQFEIIKFRKGEDNKDLSINGICPYFRILIRKKQ